MSYLKKADSKSVPVGYLCEQCMDDAWSIPESSVE